MVQEDLYWRQHAKTYWYRDGDLNTRFFSCSHNFQEESESNLLPLEGSWSEGD